ncbi:MAG: hypothetical protein PHS19_04690 [Eubacteriales bacterium]|nr:hypothetical protein [Eubacteriales bacterium]
MKNTNIVIEKRTWTEKPYSPLLPNESAELDELIERRSIEYVETSGYIEHDTAVDNAIQAVVDGKETVDNLNEQILSLWSNAFAAGYKAGMVDVMAALTLNEIGVTAAKYLKR